MPNPKTCNLRRTKPVGPMPLCSDLECFEACVIFTLEKGGGTKRVYLKPGQKAPLK